MGIIIALFCLANIPHWIEVLADGYPLYYYFPGHSFTVVDAVSKKPVEGVVALYEYRALAMGGEEWDLRPFYDFPARSIYAAYLQVANPLRREQIAWDSKPYVAYLAEAVSDARGRIVFPSVGPLLRRRNNYFHSAPIGYLLKDGYATKNLAQVVGHHRIGWKSVPDWSGETVTIRPVDAFEMQKLKDNDFFIYDFCFELYSGKFHKARVPRAFNYLAKRAALREKDFQAKVDATMPPQNQDWNQAESTNP